HSRDAAEPFARMTSSRVALWVGAIVAPGSHAEIGREGIHSIAHPCDATAAASAQAAATRKRRGPARRAGPPVRRRFTKPLLQDRYSRVRLLGAGLHAGVVLARRDAAAAVVLAVPDRRVRTDGLESLHQVANHASAHVVDPKRHVRPRARALRDR